MKRAIYVFRVMLCVMAIGLMIFEVADAAQNSGEVPLMKRFMNEATPSKEEIESLPAGIQERVKESYNLFQKFQMRMAIAENPPPIGNKATMRIAALEMAVQDVSTAIEAFPAEADDKAFLSLMYLMRGSVYQDYLMENNYRTAKSVKIDKAMAYNSLISDFTKAIELCPERISADSRAYIYLNRGVSHFYAGKEKLALKDVQYAQELAPSSAQITKVLNMMK